MRSRGGRGSRAACALAAAALAGAVMGPTGWIVTDRLERDDDFCNACHLTPEVPLHREVRADFDRRPPQSLAAAHAAAGIAERGFRCIDCHGGASPLGRLRVKVLAARDALVYLSGRFEEPDGMRHPLWDEDCRKCHADFEERAADGVRDPDFHELAVHNTALGVRCVACHLSHDPGGVRDAFFLHAGHVRRQCALCHAEFEEE